MRSLEKHPAKLGNSMLLWHQVKNPILVAINYILIELSKPMPSLSIKRALWRLAGAKIGKDVAIGLHAQLDVFFPELVEIDDNTIIGYNVTILAHEFLQDEWRTGKVRIGKNCMIGANSTVLAGVTVGDGATVSAMSLVNRDVAPRTFVEGVPMRTVKK